MSSYNFCSYKISRNKFVILFILFAFVIFVYRIQYHSNEIDNQFEHHGTQANKIEENDVKNNIKREKFKYILRSTRPMEPPNFLGNGQKVFNDVPNKIYIKFEHNGMRTETKEKNHVEIRKKRELKYILKWTRSKTEPPMFLGNGKKVFIDKKCAYTNCYLTASRNFLPNITMFDVIVFTGPEVRKYWKSMLPSQRAPHQKYVFASMESPVLYPMCWDEFDGYFNWTWTYKLNSDSKWGYLVIRDNKANIIGPNKTMHWIKHEYMEPVSEDLKNILRSKSKTAAWFVSNCLTQSKRENYVHQLQKILLAKYNTTVDVYGKCGQYQCPHKNANKCNEIVRKEYYFYLAFENAFSEDYVTEKLVRSLKFNALPIVYGGANYSRFLPEKSYINAVELTHEKLADKMYSLMTNFDEYVEYFRWTNHYYYHTKDESPATNDLCSICELLNDESRVKKKTVYTDFRSWWHQPYTECPPGDFTL